MEVLTQASDCGCKKDCQNCGHRMCMFYGEARNPVYGDRCWLPFCWLIHKPKS